MRLSFATESCPVSRYSDREPSLRKGKADSLAPDDGSFRFRPPVGRKVRIVLPVEGIRV